MSIRCGCITGTIYQGRLSSKGDSFVGKKIDVTKECINAVAEHLDFMREWENQKYHEYPNGYKLAILHKDEEVYKKEDVDKLRQELETFKQYLKVL